MIKNKKINLGDSVLLPNGQHFVVEELFIADSVRWVRASRIKAKHKNTYNNFTHISYTTENQYFTEYEWRRLVKK